jgi:hypothetical protein
MQSVGDRQEGVPSPNGALKCVTRHVPTPPAGSVEVRTFPSSSVATHSDTDGHDTPRNSARPIGPPALSTCTTRHALAPPVGSTELNPLPWKSTPTHNETDGHEIPHGSFAAPTGTTRHAPGPPAGFVDTPIRPASFECPSGPTVTHNEPMDTTLQSETPPHAAAPISSRELKRDAYSLRCLRHRRQHTTKPTDRKRPICPLHDRPAPEPTTQSAATRTPVRQPLATPRPSHITPRFPAAERPRRSPATGWESRTATIHAGNHALAKQRFPGALVMPLDPSSPHSVPRDHQTANCRSHTSAANALNQAARHVRSSPSPSNPCDREAIRSSTQIPRNPTQRQAGPRPGTPASRPIQRRNCRDLKSALWPNSGPNASRATPAITGHDAPATR